MEPAARPSAGTFLAFALTVGFVGTNFVAIRFSNEELAPLWGAAIRFGPASAIFFAIMLAKRIRFPGRLPLAGAVAFGVLSVAGYFSLLYWGLTGAPAGTAAIIVSCVPLLTYFFAWAHRLERFHWRRIAGGSLAVVGIALLYRDQVAAGTGVAPEYLLALVGAAACLAEGGVLLNACPGAHPAATNAIGMGIGALMLLFFSFIAQEPWSLPAHASTWAAVAYLTIPGTVILFLLYVALIGRWGASSTSYVMVMSPWVAVAAGAVLAHEPVTWPVLASAALVAAGVYVGISRNRAAVGKAQPALVTR